MAATGVDGTMYNVAPIGINALLPPTLVNTTTSATVNNGTTNVVTSTTLPPGTYLVGGNFSISSATNFANADTIFFYIRDTAGNLTNYPLTALSGINHIGSTPAAMAMTVSGILVLTTAGTLSWGFTVVFSTQNKTGSIGNAYFQRIS
jgi:hypothetical protein